MNRSFLSDRIQKEDYMCPVLFSIGPFTVYSYGLMTAIGIFAAIVFGEYLLKKTKTAEEGFLIGMGIACVIGGYACSKILFWLTTLPEILKNPGLLLDFSGGYVVFGGLIGGVLTGYVYCRIKKTDFFKIFDMVMPAVALAQFFGRIGCFLAGCCYGKPTESALGVVFSKSLYAPADEKLFPIQLVSSGLNLVNFFFLYFLWKKMGERTGVTGAAYIITYSIGRFFLEYFRGDLERGSVGILSTSQFIAVFTLIIGLVLMFIRLRGGTEAEKR